MNRERIAKELLRVAKSLLARQKRGDYLVLKRLDGKWNDVAVVGGRPLGTFRSEGSALMAIEDHKDDINEGLDLHSLPSSEPRVWLIKEEISRTQPARIAKKPIEDVLIDSHQQFLEKVVKQHRGKYYQPGLFQRGKSKGKAHFPQILNQAGGVNIGFSGDKTKFRIEEGGFFIGLMLLLAN
jgi:hypothetical protein